MLYLPSIVATVLDMSESALPADVTAKILAQRHIFKSFLASRVGNDADAEDLLQTGLVKAMSRTEEVRDGEKAVAWFYQLLRNVIIDHMRSRSAAMKREEAWAKDTVTLADDVDAERHICACFEKMLPALKPKHAELLRRVELGGESVAEVAAALGITPNNASVTLHRARGELRTRLIDFCGECQCLDNCECG
jgi:RNA polymerase sigma-70 factor (ECF subfamily)